MSRLVPEPPREVYMRLYRAADEIIREYNPCNITVRDDGHVECTMTRKGRFKTAYGIAACCTGCAHVVVGKGCGVVALSCKLGWCYAGTGNAPESHPNDGVNQRMLVLRREAHQHGWLGNYRRTMDQQLQGD